jgi:hypothetical protein
MTKDDWPLESDEDDIDNDARKRWAIKSLRERLAKSMYQYSSRNKWVKGWEEAGSLEKEYWLSMANFIMTEHIVFKGFVSGDPKFEVKN